MTVASMPIEVHRVVQDPQNRDRVGGHVDSTEQDVAGVASGLLDVVTEHAEPHDRAQPTDLGVMRHGSERLLEQLEVGPVLTLAPAVAGSQQDVGDVVLRLLGNSELWPLLAARGAVALADAIHDLGCGPLDDVAGVCLSYPDVECLTKRLESLLLHGV